MYIHVHSVDQNYFWRNWSALHPKFTKLNHINTPVQLYILEIACSKHFHELGTCHVQLQQVQTHVFTACGLHKSIGHSFKVPCIGTFRHFLCRVQEHLPTHSATEGRCTRCDRRSNRSNDWLVHVICSRPKGVGPLPDNKAFMPVVKYGRFERGRCLPCANITHVVLLFVAFFWFALPQPLLLLPF